MPARAVRAHLLLCPWLSQTIMLYEGNKAFLFLKSFREDTCAAHLPSQKRPANLRCWLNTAKYILESSLNTTVEQHQLWSAVVENCVEKQSWSLTVLSKYSALSLLQLKQSQKLSGFLCIVLLKTQYLREPWAFSACSLNKESEDTFSEMVGKCSVQIHSPRRYQNQGHSYGTRLLFSTFSFVSHDFDVSQFRELCN